MIATGTTTISISGCPPPRIFMWMRIRMCEDPTIDAWTTSEPKPNNTSITNSINELGRKQRCSCEVRQNY